jgi:predicted PolB exonuclease-like 3'-5' exonuclease
MSSDGSAELIPGSEEDVLRAFWDVAAKADQVVTFNGRGFDIPFIVYRSAALRIAPTTNLMPNRFSSDEHIDLMDRLSYFRAVRNHSLHYFCLLFGIESPKQGVISSTSVGELWAEGRYQDIADYCWSDVKATAELFRVWAEYVTHPPKPDLG